MSDSVEPDKDISTVVIKTLEDLLAVPYQFDAFGNKIVEGFKLDFSSFNFGTKDPDDPATEWTWDPDKYEFKPGYGTEAYEEVTEYSSMFSEASLTQGKVYAGLEAVDTSFLDAPFPTPSTAMKAVLKEEVMFSSHKSIAYHTGIDEMVATNRPLTIFNKSRAEYYQDALVEVMSETERNKEHAAFLKGLVNYGSTTV